MISEGVGFMKVDNRNELANVRRQTSALILKPVKQLCGLLLRTIVAGVVFYGVVAVTLHSLGYPVPRLSELGRYLESLPGLARILS